MRRNGEPCWADLIDLDVCWATSVIACAPAIPCSCGRTYFRCNGGLTVSCDVTSCQVFLLPAPAHPSPALQVDGLGGGEGHVQLRLLPAAVRPCRTVDQVRPRVRLPPGRCTLCPTLCFREVQGHQPFGCHTHTYTHTSCQHGQYRTDNSDMHWIYPLTRFRQPLHTINLRCALLLYASPTGDRDMGTFLRHIPHTDSDSLAVHLPLPPGVCGHWG